jgi:nitroreductase
MKNSIDTINEIIRKRRSIFPPSYVSKEIPAEIVSNIIENANFAPTHKLTEPWRFVVFTGEGLNRLAGFFSERYRQVTPPESFSQARFDAAGEKILKSSCVIAINMEVHTEKIPEWEEVASVACAVQNMWLTATAYGIGAYWSSPAILRELADFMDLPDDQKCLGLFYMGYHDAAEVPARRTPIENKITWHAS